MGCRGLLAYSLFWSSFIDLIILYKKNITRIGKIIINPYDKILPTKITTPASNPDVIGAKNNINSKIIIIVFKVISIILY